MSCCGNKRAQFYRATLERPAYDHAQATMPAQVRPAAPMPVLFEYLGASGVSAIGPVTRRLYRFDGPRSRVAIDARDAPSIARVPSLRRVR